MVNKIIRLLSHCAEYAFLRCMGMLVSIIPRQVALRLGAACGLILYYFGFYRRIVRKNMEHTALFSGDEQDRITRELYVNIGKYAVDFLRPTLPLPPHSIYNYEAVRPLFQQNRGTIVILGHLGNWEMLPTAFGDTNPNLNVIAKPMHNPFVEKWVLAKRTASKVTTIYSNQALRKMLGILKSNGIIAILIDQFMRKHGNPVPFLGKTALTVSTVAGLTVKTGCNVISICAIMQPDGSYSIQLYKLPEEPVTAPATEAEQILAVQTLHNRVLSEQITTYPAHWFGWFHKRFRGGYVDYNA